MSKLGITIVFTLMCLFCLSQQPAIVVQSFEYISPRDVTAYTRQVNMLSDEDIQQAIEKSFKIAIQKKWNVELPDLNLTLKPLRLLAKTPKFNTKLKSKQPGKWYLFLQLFDDPTTSYFNDAGGLGTRIEAKCRMIDYKDSIVFERNLSIGVNVEKAASTEVPLVKLLAHPHQITRTLDIMARWLFGPEEVTEKEVWLKPALIYTEKLLPSESISPVQFNATNSTVCVVTESTFCLRTSPKNTIKKGTDKKIVGNTAGAVLTALTGIGTGKSKTYQYEASFSFTTDDSIVYHCKIPYLETITADRQREVTRNSDGSKSYSITTDSYQLAERRADSLSENVVIREGDTIARFTINYIKRFDESNSYTRMWDGEDSTSIIPLKEEWKNNNKQYDVILQIKTVSDSMCMKSSFETRVKEFSIKQKPVLVIYGTDIPSAGVLFHPISKSDLVLFTILSSLPYSYFNYGGNEFMR